MDCPAGLICWKREVGAADASAGEIACGGPANSSSAPGFPAPSALAPTAVAIEDLRTAPLRLLGVDLTGLAPKYVTGATGIQGKSAMKLVLEEWPLVPSTEIWI